ncbi:membrane lipoprotein lipid attachment site-containing protein [uncultured Parasutterella sp.]|uniref:membrane lipoprotein lipid attachment site-containing protein n=1 Tax=uncultured Parasutterella sp. TaxID=1263098 RepID=UPI0034A3F581
MKKILFPILAALLLTGCASPLMDPIKTPDNTIPKDKAVITFFRTSSFGGAIQAPVAREKNEDDVDFVGVSSTGTQIRDVVDPGEYNYVVSGENADVLKANVEANKAYYVRVEPRMGFWKARFVLYKLTDDELKDAKQQQKIKDCQVVELNEGGKQWFDLYQGEMRSKLLIGKEKYKKLEGDQLMIRTIKPEEGLDELIH